MLILMMGVGGFGLAAIRADWQMKANATLQSLPHNSFPNAMLGLHVEDGNDHLAPLLLSRENWGKIHPEQDNKAGIKLTDIFDMDYF